MTRNLTVLDELHEKFTAAGIEHRYTRGDLVITVIRGTHVWTVSEDCILYWGASIDVCQSRWREFDWAASAYDYIADVYSKAK